MFCFFSSITVSSNEGQNIRDPPLLRSRDSKVRDTSVKFKGLKKKRLQPKRRVRQLVDRSVSSVTNKRGDKRQKRSPKKFEGFLRFN